MEDKKYVSILKKILSQNEFKNIMDETYTEVYKKFKRINQEQARNIVNLNLAAIVVYANEKTKGCKNREFNTKFYNYNIGPRIFLVERSTYRFEKRYSYYIDKVIEYIIKNNEIIRLIL